MLAQSEKRILTEIKPDDLVLDVGGWACPFNRANWVMDCGDYETRGHYEKFGLPKSQGGDKEHFSKKTWVQRDICSHEPWPFKDKQFDFSICSQTLEDVRDPIGVCAELIRVSKAGYIEFPSRLMESCRGWDRNDMVGLSHHRWLIEVRDNHVIFTPKYHLIHTDSCLSFPPWYPDTLSEEEKNTCLFWQDQFTYEETMIHSYEELYKDLSSFVAKRYKYPEIIKKIDKIPTQITNVYRRARRKLNTVKGSPIR